MKKHGVLHAELSRCIAALGHKDLFMIGDAGMPIPPGVEIIDLAVTAGVPTFRQVLDAVLEEAEVEGYYLADEIHAARGAQGILGQGEVRDTDGRVLAVSQCDPACRRCLLSACAARHCVFRLLRLEWIGERRRLEP